MIKSAIFSPCGQYRYQLTRIWDDSLPKAMCIGLNPSTANHEKDDPTINNLTAILRNNGYGGFYMMNLFALISSQPEDLRTTADPVGDNDLHLIQTSLLVSDIIFCYGSFPMAEYRVRKIRQMFTDVKCFGKAKCGNPLHPMALWRRGIKNLDVKIIKF